MVSVVYKISQANTWDVFKFRIRLFEARDLRVFCFLRTAEREGFEPSIPCGMPVFKTGALNHSATSP